MGEVFEVSRDVDFEGRVVKSGDGAARYKVLG